MLVQWDGHEPQGFFQMWVHLPRVIAVSTSDLFLLSHVDFTSEMHQTTYSRMNLNYVRNQIQAHKWVSLQAAEALKKEEEKQFLMKRLL